MKRICLGTTALSLMMLAGCASIQDEGDARERTVAERAEQRWESIITGELDVAYGMLSPAQRSAITPLAYKREVLNSPFRWKSAEVTATKCQEVTCQVTVLVGFDVVGAVPGVARFPITQDMEEQWIMTDGDWWFVSE